MRFPFVTQVMWATRAPQSHRGKVLVVIAIDGTRSHNRSFLHFSVGDVRSSLPYGSWVFVHGPEKKSVLQRLSAVAELNDEIKDVQQTTHIDSNGFECSNEFEIIADGKGPACGVERVQGVDHCPPLGGCVLVVWEGS